MADPVLKFPPEQKGNPASRPKLAAEPRRRLMAGMRRYRRFLLLVVLPLVAAIAGFTFYLNGGRYVTTDDAYVGAQKVLITPDISGKRTASPIASVRVFETALPTLSVRVRAIIVLNHHRFWGYASGPSSSGNTLPSSIQGHAARRSALPRERFSPLARSGHTPKQ